MVQKSKIDKRQLRKMLREGKKPVEIAKHFSVSRQAVSQQIGQLQKQTSELIVASEAKTVVRRELNAVDQLQRINERANTLLTQAMETEEMEVALKCMAEIRGQLKLQLEIFQSLYDVRAAQEFQEEITEILKEIDPDARNRFLARLRKRRAVR